ncbi:uncharacterized protein LOC117644062 [Thrips palmi]|uniref:Uncharacterized protein LOC117644062 n=1 Tax=Thrips palmi TaxID=161013 RepID=A0A6P8YHA0_THRPL|nr:uncharacterized protein LOC117644062 [Thrips palmi]
MTPVIVMLLVCAMLVSCSNNVAGPYYMDILQFGNCLSEEVGDVGDDIVVNGSARHYRGFKHFLFSGDITVKNGLGTQGASALTSYIAKWDPVSGWKENFVVLRIGESCRAVETYVPPFKDLIWKYYPGVPIRCPISDGTYSVYNISSHYDTFTFFPAAFYGRFRCNTLWRSLKTHSKKPIACVRWIVETTEKVVTG